MTIRDFLTLFRRVSVDDHSSLPRSSDKNLARGYIRTTSLAVSDQAIEKSENDQFGFNELVTPRLCRIVLEWPGNRGLIVGLFGSWGAGKSSALNLLAESLQKPKKYSHAEREAIVVRFTPAFYDNQGALFRAFFATLAETVGECGRRTAGLETGLRTIGLFLSAAAAGASSVTPGGQALVDSIAKVFVNGADAAKLLDQGERSLRDARSATNNGLQQLALAGQRVVVLLDDLERLDRIELVNVLKLTRFVADMPNVTFVLSMDDVRARALLGEGKEDSEYGAAYLEKFIQVALRIPPPEPQRISELIKRELQSVGSLYGDSAHVNGEQEDGTPRRGARETKLILRMVGNPRGLVRWSNTVRMMLLADERADIDIWDAAVLAAVETFHPDFLERMRQNRALLTGMYDLVERMGESEKQRRDRVSEEVRQLASAKDASTEALFREVLTVLFGDLDEIYARQNAFERKSEDEAQRRIRSEAYFHHYFGHFTEEGGLSYRSVIALVTELDRMAGYRDGHKDATTLLLATFEVLTPGQRERLLGDLHVHLGRVERDRLDRIGIAALNLPSTLEPAVAYRLLVSVVLRLCGPRDNIKYGDDSSQSAVARLIEGALRVLPSWYHRMTLVADDGPVARCLSEDDQIKLASMWLRDLDAALTNGLSLSSQYRTDTADYIIVIAFQTAIKLQGRGVMPPVPTLSEVMRRYTQASTERMVLAVRDAVGAWITNLSSTDSSVLHDHVGSALDSLDVVLGADGFSRTWLLSPPIDVSPRDDPDGIIAKVRSVLATGSMQRHT